MFCCSFYNHYFTDALHIFFLQINSDAVPQEMNGGIFHLKAKDIQWTKCVDVNSCIISTMSH